MNKPIRKQRKRLLIMVFLIVLFAACSSEKSVKYTEMPKTDGEKTAVTESTQQADSKSEPTIHTPAAVDLKQSFQSRYYYRQLSVKEQEVYAYLYEKIDGLTDEIAFEEPLDPILFHKSFYALLQDCPEFFWVTSSQVVTLESTSEIVKVIVKFDQVSIAEVKQQRRAVETVALQWLSQVGADLSTYEKVKKVFEIIVMETEYQEESTYNQDVRSVFLNRQSVCTGYARTMQFLLTKLGIPCTLANGTIGADQLPHSWNLVEIDGTYCWADPTQGDTGWKEGIISYGYLAFDDQILQKNYSLEKQVTLSTMPDQKTEFFDYPICDSQKYNLFRLEGRQYAAYEPQVIKDYILQGVRAKKRVFAVQFTTEKAFQEAVAALEEESLLGDILQELMQSEGVDNWRYRFGNDRHIQTVYLDLNT